MKHREYDDAEEMAKVGVGAHILEDARSEPAEDENCSHLFGPPAPAPPPAKKPRTSARAPAKRFQHQPQTLPTTRQGFAHKNSTGEGVNTRSQNNKRATGQAFRQLGSGVYKHRSIH